MRALSEHRNGAVKREVQPGVWLDSRRALWLAELQLLVVADLHWGYAASHRARGNLLPLWGDEQLASTLDALIQDFSPKEMLWLGDIVHAAEGSAAAERYLEAVRTPVCIIAGNHDRRWRRAGERSAVRANYFFHHGDRSPAVPAEVTEVVGHHHPAIAWYDGAGGSFKLPALVLGRRRVVLPAFSPWAAGTDCSALLDERTTTWAIAPQRIFPVVPRQKKPAAA